MKIIFNCAVWINFHKLINTLYLFASLFHQLMFYYQYLHYTICISGTTNYVTKNHLKSLFNAHWNFFGQKVPWNFLQSSIELFEQHLNNTCGSMEFHGIPWNFVQIQSSMEFHGTVSILPSSTEFHGTFNFSQKSSLEFHGTFLIEDLMLFGYNLTETLHIALISIS